MYSITFQDEENHFTFYSIGGKILVDTVAKHGHHDQRSHGNWAHGGGNSESASGSSADGANDFAVKGFRNRQKLNNHFQNGRTHKSEYPNMTKQQYEQRALELVQSPVGGNILGHKDKDDNVIRYDASTNDFVKGHPQEGVKTMFKPKDGIRYYSEVREDDIRYGGKE